MNIFGFSWLIVYPFVYFLKNGSNLSCIKRSQLIYHSKKEILTKNSIQFIKVLESSRLIECNAFSWIIALDFSRSIRIQN